MSGHALASWITTFFDLLFPPLCPVCSARLDAGRRDPLCGSCWRAIARIAPPFCRLCGVPFAAFAPSETRHVCGDCRHHRPPFTYARSAAVYKDVVREALHALKFRRVTALAGPLGDLLAEAGPALLPVSEISLIVPVPLHPARQAERTFNQAELLARRLARQWQIRVGDRVLRRVRPTQPQTELDRGERRKNVKGAFTVVRPREVKGEHVLLIDDIMTTGATASEAARALRRAGAKTVGVFTVARTKVGL